ncbi:MAG: 4-hydroxy-tetrahydrodipicolinate synthase [Acidobacteriota bacterium]|nr:4-hydroxy-tetrahydrodipicolinate synthase [Acidobacteriota bacterium]
MTPFKDNERIDYGAWQSMIDLLIAAGVHGLFVAGSQGEFYSLDMEERTVAMRFTRQAIAGRVPVYANVGCITTRDTVALALQAQALDVDAIVVVTPYYVMPSQQELTDHYVDVCRAVRLPVMAYNFPPHGGVEIEPETIGRIAAQCPNLIGIKDSSGRLEQAVAYRKAVPDRDFLVFTGGDHLFLPALDAGCAGTVTASANLAPKLFVDLYEAHHRGNRAEAARLQELATDLGSVIMAHTFPAVIKEALAMIGVPMGSCRKPVGAMPAEARERVAAVVERLQGAGMLPGAPIRA